MIDYRNNDVAYVKYGKAAIFRNFVIHSATGDYFPFYYGF